MSSVFCRRKFLSSCVGISTFLIPAVPTSTNLIHQIPREYEPLGWWYLPLWTENHECPWMVGKDDGHFWHETQIKTM